MDINYCFSEISTLVNFFQKEITDANIFRTLNKINNKIMYSRVFSEFLVCCD